MSQDVSTGNNNIQRQKPEDDSTVQSSSTNVEPNDENSPGDNNNESTANHVEQEDNRQKEDTNSRFLIFIYFVGVKSSVFMLVILV